MSIVARNRKSLGVNSTKDQSSKATTNSRSSSFFTSRVVVDIVAAIDVTLLIITAYLVKLIYLDILYNHNDTNFQFEFVTAGAAVLYLLLAKSYRLYDSRLMPKVIFKYTTLCYCVFFTFCVVIISLYFLKLSDTFSRIWMTLWFSSFGFILIFSRLFWKVIIKNLQKSKTFVQNIAVIGSGAPASKILQKIEKNSDLYHLQFYMDCGSYTNDPYQIDTLIEQGQNREVDKIIIAAPNGMNKSLINIIRKLQLLPIDIQFLPDFGDLNLSKFRIEPVGELQLVNIQPRPITNWGVLIKAVEDKVISIIGLLFSIPLFMVIAILIKIDSRGPIFFVQQRHGLNNKIINVIKFRSMYVMENDGKIIQATKNDNRVTRLGKILRKTSIDELPQLINVLKGDMSIVGPRPHAISHNNYYKKLLQNYANRHKVKPGITGWAQVNGFRGETKDLVKMKERVRYDIEYIENWSFWFDLKILLKTPIILLLGKNAY